MDRGLRGFTDEAAAQNAGFRRGEGCWYRTPGHNTAYHDYSIGFRCCATAGEE